MAARFALACLCVVLAAGAGVARADDAPPPPTRLTMDLGYVKTAGNTKLQTVTSADKLEHTTGRWHFTQTAGAVWGETDDLETAGRYSADLRADYRLFEQMSAYGLASWKRNTFAGVARQFDENAGLVWNAVRPKPHTVDIEAGLGMLQRRTTLHTEDSFGVARAGALYAYDFSSHSRFEASGNYQIDVSDTKNGEGEARVSVTAPVASHVSIKLGYDLNYRNRPEPGFEKTDTTFSTGVQATF